MHSVVDARVSSIRNQPTAFKTGVGWVLIGPDELMPSNKDSYLCLSCCDAGRLNDKMQQLFEQDFCEKSANIEFPLSVEDKLFLNKVGGSRGAARIFLRGGLKLWKQKPCKGKIACD